MNTYRVFPWTLMLPLVASVWSCSNGTASTSTDESNATSGSDTSTHNESSGTVTSTTSKPSSTTEPSTTHGTSDSDGSRTTETVSEPSDATSSNAGGDSDAGETSEVGQSTVVSETDAGTSATTSAETSSGVETTTYAFVVSVGGVVRALRLDPGAEPEQVADFEVDVTFGDFFIAATPDAARVFVAYENEVIALAFETDPPAFTELDTASTAGAGTFVEVSPDGEHVIVAHYSQGRATHVGFDGTAFGSPSEVSPGQNAHSARIHGAWAYVPCLGSNHVAQFSLGETLAPNTPASVSVPGGPRHMTFHPNGEVAYVLTELSGQAYAFAVQSDGTLGPEPLDVEDVASEVQEPWGSDVQITPDGKHLYTFLRRNQSLYHFDIAGDGTLTASGEPTNFGQEVRNFAISPSGDVLLGGGSQGVLYTYSIDSQSGALTAVGDGLRDLQSIQATVIRDVPVAL